MTSPQRRDRRPARLPRRAPLERARGDPLSARRPGRDRPDGRSARDLAAPHRCCWHRVRGFVKLLATAAALGCAAFVLAAPAAAEPFDFEIAPKAGGGGGASAAGGAAVSPRACTRSRFQLLGMRWQGA